MLIRLSIGTRAANREMKASLVEIGVQSEVETSIQLIIQAEPLSADMAMSWTSWMQLFMNRHVRYHNTTTPIDPTRIGQLQ